MGLLDHLKTLWVSGAQASEMVHNGAQLIDVRESSQWNAGHAREAVHIPSSQVGSRLKRLKKDKDIVVVCRAIAVTKQLRAQGDEAFTLHGGMRARQAADGPALDRKGLPGRIV